MRHALTAAGISLLLALGACMHSAEHADQADHAAHAPAAVVTPAEPSPRAECATAHVTLYFGEQVASDEPVVTPLLEDFMNRIRACEAAGGSLQSITIVTSADPGQTPSDARAQVQRRHDRVRAALINAGAPGDKIVGAREQQSGIMARRADITAVLY